MWIEELTPVYQVSCSLECLLSRDVALPAVHDEEAQLWQALEEAVCRLPIRAALRASVAVHPVRSMPLGLTMCGGGAVVAEPGDAAEIFQLIRRLLTCQCLQHEPYTTVQVNGRGCSTSAC